jgi:hypothetical protein
MIRDYDSGRFNQEIVQVEAAVIVLASKSTLSFWLLFQFHPKSEENDSHIHFFLYLCSRFQNNDKNKF